MPTYQYACTACGDQLEVVQSFSDDALTECPECSGRLRKVFSAVGVVFKGSGFYRTDSRSDQSSGSGSKSGGSKSSSSEGGSSGSGSASSGSSDSGSGSSGSSSSGDSGSSKSDSSSKSGSGGAKPSSPDQTG